MIQALFSPHLQAQTCINIPFDIEWTCDQEDNEFIYQDDAGVTIIDCLDPSIIYELTLPIDVEIEELGCVSETYPGVLRRITRTFVYETGDPLDVSCPSYGAGFICATQVIEVRDITPPTFSFVPGTVELECDVWDLEEYLKSNDFGLVFEDNCGIPELEQDFEIVEEPTCSAEKSFIWTFTLTDACGNLTQDTHVVNVVDTTDPVIIFSPIESEVFSCEADVIWPEISAEDLCSSVDVDWVSGEPAVTLHDCPYNMTLTRNATAEDACGNTVTEMYSIAVNDDQPPQFIDLLTDLTIQCDNTAAIDLALLDLPTFDDGCNDGAFLIPDSQTIPGVCDQNYEVEKTFVVEDACGNQSDPHIITITVEDTEAPTITLPTEGFTLECTETYILKDPDVEDNCDTPTWTEQTLPSGELSDNNLIETTTYNATDACGNNSEAATVVVAILDTELPFFTSFPEDLVVACGDNYEYGEAFYDDACTPTSLVGYELVPVFQDCANYTLITQTFTISDAAGNEATQTQEITFLDLDPPILLTPLDSLFYQCAYEVPECLEIFEGLEFDDCSSGDVVPIDCDDVVVEGNCEEQACIIERTYFFEDACGNQGSAKQYITVQESVLNPEMPTGITPNGDGLNDAFVIKGVGPSLNTEPGEVQCDWLEDTNMRVINRWGSLVFEEANYRNDWEGTNKSGEDLPQGTYFVVFEALGESFSTYLDLRR